MTPWRASFRISLINKTNTTEAMQIAKTAKAMSRLRGKHSEHDQPSDWTKPTQDVHYLRPLDKTQQFTPRFTRKHTLRLAVQETSRTYHQRTQCKTDPRSLHDIRRHSNMRCSSIEKISFPNLRCSKGVECVRVRDGPMASNHRTPNYNVEKRPSTPMKKSSSGKTVASVVPGVEQSAPSGLHKENISPANSEKDVRYRSSTPLSAC